MRAIGNCISRMIVFAALFVSVPNVAIADTPFDIKAVPRIEGASDLIVAGTNVIYVSPETPQATGKKLREILLADGWYLFDSPPFEDRDETSFEQQKFIRGADAISVYAVTAPAMANRTSVQYSLIPIALPLPIPKDATRLGYSMTAPHLEAFSSQKPAELLDFYASELGKSGWQRWTMPNTRIENPESGNVRAHFVKESQSPLLLTASIAKDGRNYVYLKAVSHEEMMLEYTPKTAEAPAKEEATPAPEAQKSESDDNTDEKFADLVQGLIKEAMKPVPKPSKKETAEKASVVPLQGLAGNSAPLPLPETASEIEHDGEDGTLEFESSSNVPSLAAFYREQMKTLGWKEKRGIMNSDRLTTLDFSKGKAERLLFTIHNMSAYVSVSVRGDSLKTADASTATNDTALSSESPSSIELSAEPVKQYALSELEVVESAALPVPKPNNSIGSTRSKFLYGANASVQASIETIVAFYRRELSKRDWQEDRTAASIAADAATLKFATKEGPAVLKVTHKDGHANIDLTVRQKALAEASGLVPKAGYVRIMFGNIEDTPGEITIGGKTFKVKAGERAEDAKSSPSIELKPGKHAFTVKSKGKPAQKDEAVFGADEIWGILIGPGGGLPLPMY